MRTHIKHRLQGPPGAPRGDCDLNPGLSEALPDPGELTPAAVLVPLVDRADGFNVLLTRRTDHLHDHAGQVSFPGGRAEDCDRDATETALRETEEEIGLARSFVEIIGTLDTYRTGTGFIITPVVGFVTPGFTLRLDSFEVAEAFEVPLAFFLDPANHQRRSLVYKGAERQFYAMPYDDYYIWGATAGMLVNLYHKLKR